MRDFADVSMKAQPNCRARFSPSVSDESAKAPCRSQQGVLSEF